MSSGGEKSLPIRTKMISTDGEQMLSSDVARASDGASNGIDTDLASAKATQQPAQLEEDSKIDHGVVVTDAADLPEPKAKKKKKKNRSAGQRGLGKPTGMETFFADVPPTPEEAAEDRKRYNPALPLLDRLLTAIQRFERTRKLTPERRDVFYKWLHYGGIIIAPNVGSGGQNVTEMDKDQEAQALSQALMPEGLRAALESVTSDDPKYAVDFLGCMQSFLSRQAPSTWEISTKARCHEITSTCMRFMEYFMQHDVCNEYRDDILAARDLCKTADDEMWSCAEAQRWLPGDFNVACSTLFGGSYAQLHNPIVTWDNQTHDNSSLFVGFTQQEATEIFSFAVAGAASPEVFEKYEQLNYSEDADEGLEITETIKGQGFEIIALAQPTAECEALYKANTDKHRPVGHVFARPWLDIDLQPEDLTPGERASSNAAAVDQNEEPYVFFVESIVLQHLKVGQKITATVRRLNCGIWFFDELMQVLPSFDLWLPNEMVEDYREPRWLENAYVPGAHDCGSPSTQEAQTGTSKPSAEDEH